MSNYFSHGISNTETETSVLWVIFSKCTWLANNAFQNWKKELNNDMTLFSNLDTRAAKLPRH